MSEANWRQIAEEVPCEGQPVRYYFDLLGEFDGVYDGKEGGLHCFSSEYGFLCGDVTHWKPR